MISATTFIVSEAMCIVSAKMCIVSATTFIVATAQHGVFLIFMVCIQTLSCRATRTRSAKLASNGAQRHHVAHSPNATCNIALLLITWLRCCARYFVLVKYIVLVPPPIVRPDHQMQYARLAQIAISLPLFSKWCKIWICDVFWSQHLGCLGRTMSRIQNKEAYATLSVQYASQSVQNSASLSRIATRRR